MQLWRLHSPLAALDVRCWAGRGGAVPLPPATCACLARFAAANATALAAELGTETRFAADLVERSRVRRGVTGVGWPDGAAPSSWTLVLTSGCRRVHG